MSSIDVQAYSDALNCINQSPVFEKIFKADSVDIDRNGFCRYFVFEDDVFNEVKDELGSVVSFSSGTMEEDEEPNSIEDLLTEIVFKASFVDDEYVRHEYYISIKQLLEAEILEDGSVKVQGTKPEHEPVVLTFYKIAVV
jgi:hypothetical protein